MSSSLILCFLLVGILVPRGGLCGESVGDEDLRGKELERAEKEHNTESWEETKGAVDPRAIDFDGDYQLVVYEPSTTVKNLHNMPRVTGENNFDFDDGEYVLGIVVMGLIFFAAGIVILVFVYGSTCLRVCGCCGCARKQSRIDSDKWKIAGLIVGLSVLIGLICALVGAIQMLHQVSDSIDVISDEMLGDFESVVVLINDIAEAAPSAASIQNELAGTSLDGVTIDIDGEEILLIDAIVLIYNDTRKFAVDLADILQDFIEDTREILDKLQDIVSYFEIAVIALMTPSFFFVIWLLICLLLAKRGTKLPMCCGRTAFCIVFFSLLIIIIVCFALFAGEITISVLLADFCMSPDDNTVELFSGTSQEVVEFYVTCELPPVVFEAIDDLIEFSKEVISEINETAGTDIQEKLEDYIDEIEEFVKEYLEIFARITCQNINQYYVNIIYESACNSLVSQAVLAWSGLVAASLFLCPFYVIYDQSFGIKGNFQKDKTVD